MRLIKRRPVAGGRWPACCLAKGSDQLLWHYIHCISLCTLSEDPNPFLGTHLLYANTGGLVLTLILHFWSSFLLLAPTF